MKEIYLDTASTTDIDPRVLSTMLPYFDRKFANPSSLHKFGRNAKAMLDESREKIALLLGAVPEEIIFTGSGTESDNLAILGIMNQFPVGSHLIISAIEHKAVIEPARKLEQLGYELTIIPVDRDGLISVDECIKSIKPHTKLISVMYANNEIGTVEPIKELSEKLNNYRKGENYPLLHTDACQAPGHLSINIKELGVDMMSLNSSKIYGPKGIGLLYFKQGIKIAPIIIGGGQESGKRSGTENIPLVVGFAKALEIATTRNTKDIETEINLRDYFINRVLNEIKDSHLNGHRTKRLSNNVHFTFPKIEGESIVLLLDNEGIFASTGSACASKSLSPSHVLHSIGVSLENIHGSVRFSLDRDTTKADIDYTIEKLKTIVERLSSFSALNTKVYEKA